jgi:AcrR family transcriptional regulator
MKKSTTQVKQKSDATAKRGRPRAYDPDRALANARNSFWRAGYAGTSVEALSDATDMNKPSLYAAFGDKRSLYLTTLERYIAEGAAGMDAALDPALPLEDALMRVYDAALALYFPRNRPARGCFLINTAASEALVDRDVRATLQEGLREFDERFERCIRHAREREELPADADPAALAKVASAILHTLALRSRAGDSVESLRATALTGVALICRSRKRSR